MSISKSHPAISVIIPVRNEAAKIRDCIEGILSQSVPVKEIIVIDSGSTDGTVDILRGYNQVKLIEIPGKEFNHGDTRNLGVSQASGDYCLLTVGDARPADNDWIKKLLDGFTDDKVAGVCGMQIVPHETDKNPVEWFRPASAPTVNRYQFTVEEFEKLSPLERKNACAWDDVSAMYRRDVLLKIPFRRITYGEDALWAKDALLAGYAIVYNNNARVYHYHLVDDNFTFKRTLTTLYFRYRHFGYIPPPLSLSVKKRLSMAKLIVTSQKVPISDSVKWWNYNIGNTNAWNRAYRLFNEALSVNEQELDKLYETHCGQPPIPVK